MSIVRLFVALSPPPTAVEELWTATAPVRDAHPELRWVRPGQCHLTLAFLGEVGEDTLPDLVARLGRSPGHDPRESHVGVAAATVRWRS